uniref:Calcium-transporting ATPase n=1 Tax=Rhizophora mucronata TaxID=61149 RepID=A0A2P2MNK1_RHIMU
MMISEFSLATSVPCMPIERPMSASCNAGASFVPSPVTATTCPFFFKACTSRSLSLGEDRPITDIFSAITSLSSSG